MVPHEPGDRRRLFRVQTQARAQILSHFRAEFRMIAAPAFRNIVQQYGHVEHFTRQDLVYDLAFERMVVRQEALLDAAKDADRAYRVLIGRVNVVHVVLHLRDDPAKIAHKLAEDTCLVESP